MPRTLIERGNSAMSEDILEYHRLLELSPTAGPGLIKAAFRRSARSVHPDLNPDDPDAAAKFSRVQKAFSVLIALAEYREAKQRRSPDKAPPKEVEWRMVKLERDGFNLIYHLSLPMGRASAGGRLVVPHRIEKRCPHCRGRAGSGARAWPLCFQKAGYVKDAPVWASSTGWEG